MHKDFRTAWLLLLLRDGSSYGYQLRRALAERDMRLDPAVLYRSLREMERGGFIASSWVTSGEGPKRRVYDLTPAGHDELARIAGAVQRSRDAQNEFLDAYENGAQPPRAPA